MRRSRQEVESGNLRDLQAIGFALGDVSQDWQHDVLTKLAADPRDDVLRVFAYAIWRERHFVEKFTLSDLQAILASLTTVLSQVAVVPLSYRNTVQPLELLLGLLRTRSSKDPAIALLLQPHQRITKELAKQVDRVADLFAKSKARLDSRLHYDLQKPKEDSTRDLLYALRLYLTGDDGANAIHLTTIDETTEAYCSEKHVT